MIVELRDDTTKIMTVRIVYLYILFFLLILQSSKAEEGDVRLVGSDVGYKGRVEVEHDGLWGTICSNGWDINDAHVVCKQLGFQSGAFSTGLVLSYPDVDLSLSGSILYQDVACTGTETHLSQCTKTTFNTCSNTQDIAVICTLPDYLGCYVNRPSTWHQSASTIPDLTVEKCLFSCRIKGFQIAALYDGTECLCGNDQNNLGMPTLPSMCSKPCMGDADQMCGGSQQITSYYNVDLGAPGYNRAADSGLIASPNFPGTYTQGVTSEWLITFSQPSYVQVWFSQFEILSGDYVSVSSEVGGDIRVFLGGSIPDVWWSEETGRLDVLFMTNYMVQKASGFLLHYDSTTTPPPSQLTTTTPSPTTTTLPTTTTVPTTATAATTTRAPEPVATTRTTTTQKVTTRIPTSTAAPTTQRVTTKPATTTQFTRGNEFCSETHGAEVIQRIDTDPTGSVLMINHGNPFKCNGFVTGASHWSKRDMPFNISIWRQEREDEYYIVGRMHMPATPPTGISEVELPQDEWLPFREGDYLGFSYFDVSPLVYATGGTTPEATKWFVWVLNEALVHAIDDMHMGDMVTAQWWHEYNRAYSVQVTTRDKRRCYVPEVPHGTIMPTDVDHVYEGDMLVVDCDPGYKPHFMVAKCLATGVFDFDIKCDGDVPKENQKGLTFPQIIMMVVAVGLLGLFVLVISCALVCGNYFSTHCFTGSHRTSDYTKEGLKQSDGFSSVGYDSQEKKVNLIPIDDDGVSAVGTEFGIDNPGLEDNRKIPLYGGDSGGIRYNKYIDDDHMGSSIYDPGNFTAPPYDSNDYNNPPESIARLFAGQPANIDQSAPPERVDEEIPPPPPGPAPPPPPFAAEGGVTSPFSAPRPTSFLNTDNNLNTSMSTIDNPVASTPSDTPANIFPME